MSSIQFPGTIPQKTPVGADVFLLSDSQDGNKLKITTTEDIVQGGIGGISADDIQDGSSKKIMTSIERSKLSTVQYNAQQNTVNSVNGQNGNIILDQDDIPNGSNFVRTENNYDNVEKQKVNNANTHANISVGNPHNVTKSDVGLSNVKNSEQISISTNEFSSIPQKAGVGDQDRLLIENSLNGFQKGYVEVGDIVQHTVDNLSLLTDKSIVENNGKIELENDVSVVENNHVYSVENDTRGRYPNMNRSDYNNDDICVDSNRHLILYGNIKGIGNLKLLGHLKII